MKNYMFVITLYDSGLPYPSDESAMKDAKEWAEEISHTENCQIADVQVKCEDEEEGTGKVTFGTGRPADHPANASQIHIRQKPDNGWTDTGEFGGIVAIHPYDWDATGEFDKKV